LTLKQLAAAAETNFGAVQRLEKEHQLRDAAVVQRVREVLGL
jgi:hypothetical protein